jgi:serine/threonine protein kinase/lipopolysaccharide biosynthesis regulator YciM
MTESESREEHLFLAALAMPNDEQRAAWLRAACGENETLYARVLELLAGHQMSCGPLDQRPVATNPELTVAQDYPPRETADAFAGMTIAGRYKLLELIGEGGMGTVWKAEQAQPVRRTVAIKLIKAGMDSHHLLARFEAERQALALMDHPNIAKVLDAGVTQQGRPFFAMEFVQGKAVMTFCDEARLSLDARLRLFVDVCRAIQHAHQKGIIHRDLKPSNILVGLVDGRPVAKVIDFGLAKALHQSLTEQSLHTAGGIVLGTPLYMSPEQAEPNNPDIDTRADIYALGVILYELLTGMTPLDRIRFKTAAWHEILRMVREDEPLRPSSRLLESGASLPSISSQRQTEPLKLTRLLQGELDWIVMKAIDKDRGRRYETAVGFAMDIERYLAGEAVLASPPSATYRLRKLLRRNKVPVLAASLVTLALLVGVIVSGWQAYRATQAREDARHERDSAITAREQERLARIAQEKLQRQAQQSAEEAESVLQFLQDEVLKVTRPELQEGGLGFNVTIRAAVDAAEPKISHSFQNQPLVEASIRYVLGGSYWHLGEWKAAIHQLARSRELRLLHLGPDHPETLRSSNDLGMAYERAGKSAQALPLLEEAFVRRKATLGEKHRETLTSMNNLATVHLASGHLKLAVDLHEQSLALRTETLGQDHAETITSINDLAAASDAVGKVFESIQLFELAAKRSKAKLGAEHPDTLQCQNNLATAYQKVARIPESIALCQEVLALQEAKLPPNHPNTLVTTNNLAQAYLAAGMIDRAVELHQKVLARRTAILGDGHPETIESKNNLGGAHHAAGNLETGVELIEGAVEACKRELGSDHPLTLQCANNLATAYQSIGRIDESVSLCRSILETQLALLGQDHPQVLFTMNNLAQAYSAAGEIDRAIELQQKVLAARQETLGDDHPATIESVNNLGGALFASGDLDASVKRIEGAVAACRRTLGLDHPLTLQCTNNLATAYQGVSRMDESVTLCRSVLETQRPLLGQDHPNVLATMNNLAQIYLKSGRLQEGMELHQQTLTLRTAKLGVDHPNTIESLNNLSGPLLVAGQTDKALELLSQAMHRSDAKFGPNHPMSIHVLNNMVGAYQLTKRFADAAKQLRELAAMRRANGKPNSLELARQLAVLGNDLLIQKQFNDAEATLRECLAIRQQLQPDLWNVFNAMCMLGESLRGQQRFAEAEPMMLQGYHGMLQRAKTLPPQAGNRIPEALGRLVELYADWNAAEPDKGYDTQAAEWQKKLDEKKSEE